MGRGEDALFYFVYLRVTAEYRAVQSNSVQLPVSRNSSTDRRVTLFFSTGRHYLANGCGKLFFSFSGSKLTCSLIMQFVNVHNLVTLVASVGVQNKPKINYGQCW